MTTSKLELLQERLVELAREINIDEESSFDLNQYLSSPLGEIGIDSLAALELAVHLEREFDIKLDGNDLSQIQTLNDIVGLAKDKGLA